MRVPYIIMHSPKARGDMYLLLSAPSPSHANVAEDLNHNSRDPNIVGGGILSLSKNGDTWNMNMEARSHYGTIPEEVQDRFAQKIKRTLALKGVEIDQMETIASDSDVHHHWENKHQAA